MLEEEEGDGGGGDEEEDGDGGDEDVEFVVSAGEDGGVTVKEVKDVKDVRVTNVYIYNQYDAAIMCDTVLKASGGDSAAGGGQ